MIETTAAYKSAIVGDVRRILAKAVVNVIDPDITFGTVTASSEAALSKSAQLYDKVLDNPDKIATLEDRRWKLDGTWEIKPTDTTDCCIAYMGGEVCDENGDFSPAAWVQENFSNVSVLQACGVCFSTAPWDGYAVDFTIEVYSGATAYFSKTVTGNNKTHVEFEGFTVYNPTAIRLTVTKWSAGYRRLRCIEIVPGMYETWSNDILAEIDIAQEINPSCLSLPYGTCTLAMDNLSRRFEPRSKNGLFQSIEERQAVPIYLGAELADGSTEYVPVGVYYQKSGGWSTGDNGLTMHWDLVDIIGLLADREFIAPASLPTTLAGWAAELVSQLGTNFDSRYSVDTDYASSSVTATADDLKGLKCGEILRYICMVTGTFPRADSETGYLCIEPTWQAGNEITLDNLAGYPTMAANDDLSAVIFTLHDTNKTTYTVSGNNTASSKNVSINNPFMTTTAQAITAARNILTFYGGNKFTLSGRGDMASELGDVDRIELSESVATSARRIAQGFNFSGGVMGELPSTLLQADGSFLYQERVTLTGSGTWTAPEGVTSIRYILVGGGDGGDAGTGGDWSSNGTPGTAGQGGKITAQTVNINEGQSFSYSCGAGGAAGAAGTATTFGEHSSASGQRFNGFSDIANGDVFGRDGVSSPLAGSGDGGTGGAAGRRGISHEEHLQTVDSNGNLKSSETTKTVIDSYPTAGGAGTAGASGRIIIYYDKAVTT